MTMATFLLIGCGLWGILFGCPQGPGPGYVQSRQDMHALEQRTEQHEIDARLQAAQAQEQTEQQRIEQQRLADHLNAQTEQQRIQAHATSEALAQREQTYRTEVTQTAATERLYAGEMQRTARLRMIMQYLTLVTLILVALYALNVAADWLPRKPQRVDLPAPPPQPQPITWEQFWAAAEALPYDIVQHQDGQVYGVLYMNGTPVFRLLPGEVSE